MAAIVIPRICGGLGNQLFIYAAARRLALINDAELILDTISGFAYDHKYLRSYQLNHFSIPCRMANAADRLEPFARVRRKLKRSCNTHRIFEQRSYIKQEGLDFDPRLLSLRPKRRLFLEGYWQSESYFKDVEPQIRADLCIEPPTDSQNYLVSQRIRNELSVAVHVRFFDVFHTSASDAPATNNASSDYYQRAIETMDKCVPGAHYFVFSDRPYEARGLLHLPESRVTLVHHNQGDAMAYADLWLMNQCQHFIIANSTFSWWGAWLAENFSKVVVAPGFVKYTGPAGWGFKGLLPDEWIKV